MEWGILSLLFAWFVVDAGETMFTIEIMSWQYTHPAEDRLQFCSFKSEICPRVSMLLLAEAKTKMSATT